MGKPRSNYDNFAPGMTKYYSLLPKKPSKSALSPTTRFLMKKSSKSALSPAPCSRWLPRWKRLLPPSAIYFIFQVILINKLIEIEYEQKLFITLCERQDFLNPLNYQAIFSKKNLILCIALFKRAHGNINIFMRFFDEHPSEIAKYTDIQNPQNIKTRN